MGLLDSLFQNSDTKWLKEKCPSLFGPQGNFNNLPSTYSVNNNVTAAYRNENLKNANEYYKTVERGNKYVEDLLESEEKFMKLKYGEDLYKYFVDQRKNYINETITNRCAIFIGTGVAGKIETSDTIFLESEFKVLKNTWDLYSKSLKIKENNSKTMQEEDNLDNRKFSYILKELEQLDSISNTLFYLYYFLFVLFLFYMGINNKFEIKKNIFVYLIICIIPFISKYIFFVLLYFYEYLRSLFFNSSSGPKNAFLNETFV